MSDLEINEILAPMNSVMAEKREEEMEGIGRGQRDDGVDDGEGNNQPLLHFHGKALLSENPEKSKPLSIRSQDWDLAGARFRTKSRENAAVSKELEAGAREQGVVDSGFCIKLHICGRPLFKSAGICITFEENGLPTNTIIENPSKENRIPTITIIIQMPTT